MSSESTVYSPPLATTLASHFARVDYGQIDRAPRHEMKRLLLDHLGVALAGSASESGQIVADFTRELGGVREATVLGHGFEAPAANAAFANAISGHSIELDDVDELALFHYGPPVMAAALAVAQRQNASGLELIDAALAGCEMMARLSRAVNPSLRNRGFHTTPTCGVFGAAVASGRLLRLSAAQLTSALGLAGAQASGLMEMYGPSMQKRMNPAPAARNGVVAALLAQRGFTGADTIFEGERGFGRAFSDAFDPSPLLDGLGSEIPVYVEYKPYSCARPIHNAIDCALEVRRTLDVGPAEIAEITVYRHPDWSAYHRNAKPSTFHEAQVSLPYSVAVAFADGEALPTQYQDERLADPELVRIATLVRLETDPRLPRGVSCRMAVTTTDGRETQVQVDDALGSLGRPLSDADLARKFVTLTSSMFSPGHAQALARSVIAIDGEAHVNDLLDQSRPDSNA
jgi:2-methylcitrate dehydratase PrpD